MQSFLIFLTYYNLFVKHESKSSNSLRWVWHQTVLVFKLYSTEILEEHRWTREPSILWQIRRTNNRIAFFPFCQCGWNRRRRDVINAGSSSSVWQIFQPKPILFFCLFPRCSRNCKSKRMLQQWQLFPVAASKCEYDETSVNKSDGKAPSYKYAAVLSHRPLFSLLYHHGGFIGFCALFGKVGSRVRLPRSSFVLQSALI